MDKLSVGSKIKIDVNVCGDTDVVTQYLEMDSPVLEVSEVEVENGLQVGVWVKELPFKLEIEEVFRYNNKH